MPDPPVEQFDRTMKVIGRNAVRGHATGETFSDKFTAEQENFYVTGGHLEVVGAGATLTQRSRAEVDELARAAGVEAPETLPNKQAVIDAIDAARPATPQAEEE